MWEFVFDAIVHGAQALGKKLALASDGLTALKGSTQGEGISARIRSASGSVRGFWH